ncbi:MAG: LPS assembly protein LptD [Nitrospirota bacterium]|nr:LPS assembly protein LptD [Nitrospirota bacterium]
MGRCSWSVLGLSSFVLVSTLAATPTPTFSAQSTSQSILSVTPTAAEPVEISADRLEYTKETETYEAVGSVVVLQGALRLTADHVTLHMLTGILIATGQVHLSKQTSDLWAARLELNLNTEAGVVSNGTLFAKDSNTLVTARLFQRFSEDHYRAKEGSFTNCDAMQGQTPAWRFTFEDVDLTLGDSVYLKNAWFCINDIPLIPIPRLKYPLATRKSGFLLPTIGYDNRFGFRYRQGYFWAVTPSQDVTIAPAVLSDRGYGGDLEYRYVLSRRTRGQWLLSSLLDTDQERGRGLLSGSHTQQVNPDLFIRAQAFLVSDRTFLEDLSSSGVLRALPSGESTLNVQQGFPTGKLYLLGQYLQPLEAGGRDSFQRLPEVGHRLASVSLFDSPLLVEMDTTLVYFFREQGFTFGRADLMPSLSTDLLNIGHAVGIKPQVRLREVYYTRGAASEEPEHRETFWVGLRVASQLVRRFNPGSNGRLLHTIEPEVIYEFVPPTDQANIAQIDAVDDLGKKSLVTYSLRTRLLTQSPDGSSQNRLDLTVAQSYHMGAVQTQARSFTEDPVLGTTSQPLQPATVRVEGRKFSDIWTRAVLGKTARESGQDAVSLMIDTFFDTYRGNLSQWNTDLRYQHRRLWYLQVGQRHTRAGNRVRRGDIWNPISFNEVFAPTDEINFASLTAAVRAPLRWTLGTKAYYDFQAGASPELDVVGLYQNPCRCWSLGLYYIKFPDREQYNFLVNLTGLGSTEGFGTQLLQAILSPLLGQERGVPWSTSTSIKPQASPDDAGGQSSP